MKQTTVHLSSWLAPCIGCTTSGYDDNSKVMEKSFSKCHLALVTIRKGKSKSDKSWFYLGPLRLT